MSNIKIFRLLSGDDIIGELIPETKKLTRTISIKDPMRILTEYDPKSKLHHTFLVRWLPQATDRIFIIPKNKLLLSQPATPIEELEDHYYDVCDDTWDVEDIEDPAFLERQERRLMLKLMLEKPTREEDIN
jgi:hypothetical protein